VGRPEGKRPLGKPDRRREKNVEINFQETGRGRGRGLFLRIGTNGMLL